MLKLVEDEGLRLFEFCKRDSFGTKIAGYFKTFKTDFNFALFWLQIAEDKKVTAAVCKIYGSAVVCAADDADFTELSQFLKVTGFCVLSCDLSVCEKLRLEPVRQGNIVEICKVPEHTTCKANIEDYPELPKLYELLTASGFSLGDSGEWMADISARMRKDVAQWCIVRHEDEIKACACALFITDDAAFFGCVASDYACRGTGLGSDVVLTLAKKFCVDKRVNLFCKDGGIVDFYKKLGFSVVGRWAEIEYIG
ncbi:MAG: GNAT family N-acetyltransferase [Clostridia bacterium]|nr:GNAT family N-acetyltransferase [Clostridia bacterium]